MINFGLNKSSGSLCRWVISSAAHTVNQEIIFPVFRFALKAVELQCQALQGMNDQKVPQRLASVAKQELTELAKTTKVGTFLTSTSLGQLVLASGQRVVVEKLAMLSASSLYSRFFLDYPTAGGGYFVGCLVQSAFMVLPSVYYFLQKSSEKNKKETIAMTAVILASTCGTSYLLGSRIPETCSLITSSGAELFCASTAAYYADHYWSNGQKEFNEQVSNYMIRGVARNALLSLAPNNFFYSLGYRGLTELALATLPPAIRYMNSPEDYLGVVKLQKELEAQIYKACFTAALPYLETLPHLEKGLMTDSFSGLLQLLTQDTVHIFLKGLSPFISAMQNSVEVCTAFEEFEKEPESPQAYEKLEQAIVQELQKKNQNYKKVHNALDGMIQRAFIAKEHLLNEWLDALFAVMEPKEKQYFRNLSFLMLQCYVPYVLCEVSHLLTPITREENDELLMMGTKASKLFLTPILGTSISRFLTRGAEFFLQRKKQIQRRMARGYLVAHLKDSSKHVEVVTFFLQALPSLQNFAHKEISEKALQLTEQHLGRRVTQRLSSLIQGLSGDGLSAAFKALNRFAHLLKNSNEIAPAYRAFVEASEDAVPNAYKALEQTVFQTLNTQSHYRALYSRHKSTIEGMVENAFPQILAKREASLGFQLLDNDQKARLQRLTELFSVSYVPLVFTEISSNPVNLADNRMLVEHVLEGVGAVVEPFIGSDFSSAVVQAGLDAAKASKSLEEMNENPIKIEAPSISKRFTLNVLLFFYTLWLKICQMFKN